MNVPLTIRAERLAPAKYARNLYVIQDNYLLLERQVNVILHQVLLSSRMEQR